MIDKFTAKTFYPCHPNKGVNLSICPNVPLQKFDRECPTCKLEWVITTRVTKRDPVGTTVTIAEWTLPKKGE